MTEDAHVNFSASAELRKCPSLNNQRREGRDTYLIVDGTLDECTRAFAAKPEATHHLYEIHTAPQPPLITGILSAEHIHELSRLKLVGFDPF